MVWKTSRKNNKRKMKVQLTYCIVFHWSNAWDKLLTSFSSSSKDGSKSISISFWFFNQFTVIFILTYEGHWDAQYFTKLFALQWWIEKLQKNKKSLLSKNIFQFSKSEVFLSARKEKSLHFHDADIWNAWCVWIHLNCFQLLNEAHPFNCVNFSSFFLFCFFFSFGCCKAI